MTAPRPLHWHALPFAALSPTRLYAILQERSRVFVLEQRCAYLDIDGKDALPGVQHLFAEDPDGTIHAYLRLLPAGVSFAEASLGRVLTATAARGGGLGHELMQRGLLLAQSLWPRQPIRIGAQAHLQGFYRRHGFVTVSAEYDEDGIAHVDMLRAGTLSD